MSSTSNVQAYLTSVFRPVYTYTPATSNFTTQLDISNVNTVDANTLIAFRADISDSNNNVFVGTGAGVNFLNLQNSSNNTAFGFNAGSQISNSCNVSNATSLKITTHLLHDLGSLRYFGDMDEVKTRTSRNKSDE